MKRKINKKYLFTMVGVVIFIFYSKSVWFFMAGEFRKYSTYYLQESVYYKDYLSKSNQIILGKKNYEIVVIGDSIAYSLSPIVFDSCCSAEAINLSIPGETTATLLDRVSEQPYRELKNVYLLIGINDIGRNVSVSTIINNYRLILNYFAPQSINIIEIPYTDNWERDNSKITIVNNKLEELCKELGIEFISVNDVLSVNKKVLDNLSADGLHLRNAGVELVAEKIAQHYYTYVKQK